MCICTSLFCSARLILHNHIHSTYCIVNTQPLLPQAGIVTGWFRCVCGIDFTTICLRVSRDKEEKEITYLYASEIHEERPTEVFAGLQNVSRTTDLTLFLRDHGIPQVHLEPEPTESTNKGIMCYLCVPHLTFFGLPHSCSCDLIYSIGSGFGPNLSWG